MAKLKAVLLDLDGTLRDTRDAIYAAYQQAIKAHTGRDATRDEIKPHVHHHSVVHKAFAGHISFEQFEETYAGFVDPAIDAARLYAGAESLLGRLRAEGYKIAIVTSASQQKTEKFLETLKIADKCDSIVGMNRERKPKPAPDLLEIALRELRCRPAEAIMVGDMVVDIQAAHAAGMRGVGITHGFATRAELALAGAEIIIDTLAQLPAAIKEIEAK